MHLRTRDGNEVAVSRHSYIIRDCFADLNDGHTEMVSDSTTPTQSFDHTCSLCPSCEHVDVPDPERFLFPPDFFPKPSLSAWPNSVASENSSVILRCVSPTPGIQLVLRKGDSILDSRPPHHLTEGTA